MNEAASVGAKLVYSAHDGTSRDRRPRCTIPRDAVWNLFNSANETTPDTRQWFPFAFTPSTVPGFVEYKATYSHFRILKAKLYISRNVLNVEGSTNNYLVV